MSESNTVDISGRRLLGGIRLDILDAGRRRNEKGETDKLKSM